MKSIIFSLLFSIIILFSLCVAQPVDSKTYEGVYNIIIKNNYEDSNEKVVDYMYNLVNKIVNSNIKQFNDQENIEQFGKAHQNNSQNSYIYKINEFKKDMWFKAYLNEYTANIVRADKFVVNCEPDARLNDPNSKKVEYKCRAQVKGFPCCKPNTEIFSVDADGYWGYNEETGEWCGISPYFENKYTYM